MWVVREKERDENLRRQNEEQGILPEGEENKPEKKWKMWLRKFWIHMYYSKIFRAMVIIIAAAVVIPIFIILFLDVTNPTFDEAHTCSAEVGYQISCGVKISTYEQCAELKCCFNETDKTCFHKIPSYYQYTQNEEEANSNLFHAKEEKTPFDGNSLPVYLYVKKESSYKLTITLSTEEEKDNAGNMLFENEEYKYVIFKNLMGVEVNRTKNLGRLLSTTRGPTIVSNRYFEWTVDMFAEHLFGMDLLRIPDNETITKVFYKNSMDHSSVARFMSFNSGKFHGLEIEHAGPLEVTVTEAKLLVLKLFSGSKLMLKLTTGPKPVDVVTQFRNNEISPPVPQWVLGVHVCRDGIIKNVDEILSEVNNFQMQSSFPYDSDCLHENLFSLSRHKDNAKVVEAVKKIKSRKKFLMSLSPQILVDDKSGSHYKEAEKLNILYKYTKDGEIVKGSFLDKTVAFPDYSSSNAQQWFQGVYDSELAQYQPDGFILRNSWPVNDKYELTYKDKIQLAHLSKEVLSALSHTLPWDSLSSSSTQHIEVHNSYGLEFSNVVASQTKSPFILSGAFTQGSNYHTHIQNINATWVNFKQMLRKTLSHSLFGGQLFSVPVCGDTTNFSITLNQGVCTRWYLTASTMPLFRISSDVPRRFPDAYNDARYVKNIMIDAIRKRYSFIPYYSTVLSERLPMVRPMFFNFPDMNDTFDLDEQYMIGDALLVAQPSLFPTPNMQVYLPNITGGWFDFWGGDRFLESGWITVPMTEGELIVYVAAGYVVPLRDGTGNSVGETAKNPLKLVIALNCSTDDATCTAKGTMWTENSITLKFLADKISLTILEAKKCDVGSTPDFVISILKVYDEDVKYYKMPDETSRFCISSNAVTKISYSSLSPI